MQHNFNSALSIWENITDLTCSQKVRFHTVDMERGGGQTVRCLPWNLAQFCNSLPIDGVDKLSRCLSPATNKTTSTNIMSV